MEQSTCDASVIIITHERPTYLGGCLASLKQQTAKAAEIVVIDSSRDSASAEVTSDYEAVRYVRNGNGFGNMPLARNLGVEPTSSSIVCFIDDDAVAEPDWLSNMMATFEDESVVAAGGRTLNNQPGEAELGITEIRRLLPDGTLTGNFAALPGSVVKVDHVIGCDMAFRRSSLVSVGAFDHRFSGPVRDETPVCLRLRQRGGRTLFNPSAIVHHLAAPHARGRRFGWRHRFYTGRNHTMMLVAIYGFHGPRTQAYPGSLRPGDRTVGEWDRSGARLLGALAGVVRIGVGDRTRE